jgi:TetR/AcrR family transcriptional repressor of nem operon
MSRKPNAEARERILCAAYKLYHREGFRGVSMDDVADEAGLKKANLFHYYPTKEALALAVLEYGSCCIKSKVSAQFAEDGKNPIRTVEKMFDEILDSMKGSDCTGGCFIGNLAQEVSDQNEKLRAKIDECLQFWIEQLALLLERQKAKGFFRKDLKSRPTAEAILALFEGSLLFTKASKRTGAIENARAMASAHLQFYKA